MTARQRVAWLAGYVGVTFLSFPHPIGSHVLDLGLSLAWFGPALLLLGLEGLRVRRALALGFLAGLAAHAAILHWIYVVTVVYGRAPVPVGFVAPVLLATYIALFPALFSGGWAWLGSRGRASPLAAAALWTVCEHLRSFALTGFPWATLGYSQHQNAALLPWVSFTGVYGLSFATAWGGAALASAWSAWRAGRRIDTGAWVAFAGLVVLHALGPPLASAPEAESGRVRVAVLQGNIDQGVKWSPEFASGTLEIYEDLTRRAAGEGARVVVWPETAVPGSLETDAELRERLATLARDLDAWLVLGAVGVVRDGRAVRYYDSAYLVDPEIGFVDRYDKSHLVPFGEYVPLRDLLGLFVRTVASGMTSSDVAAGPGPRPLAIRLGGTSVTVGVPICYELIFPDLVRRFVRDGASVLFAITNDAWYGRTGAPYQFLAITAVRSAETRVWTARAANTGVSAFIDERGRVRAQTSIFERGLLVEDVPLRPSPIGGSFYTRHGDVFALGCWLGLAALGFAARRRRGARERNATHGDSG